MNPHKANWYASTAVEGTRRPDIRARLRSARFAMLHGHSDKTKWERIGRPLFVETPLDVAEFVFDFLFRITKLRKLL